VRATSQVIRLFIRALFWEASEKGLTFDAVLKASARAKLTETVKGKVLVGTAANGVQASFALPAVGDVTQADVTEFCSLLLDTMDEIKAGEPSITDAALEPKLLACFQRNTVSRCDFSGAL
jgi:hypothetical protein